jgi:hypothetical protein
MPILTQSFETVKSTATRVAQDLQLKYYVKVTQLLSELDPESLVDLCDSLNNGGFSEVTVQLAICVFNWFSN